MKRSVAVIGAGIFGCEIAIELANKGFLVELYEQNENILSGATAKSQNRLHLGLHYPRDIQTAIQSRLGFGTFSERFPTAVRKGFPNYYCIARKGSKVNSSDFEKFALNAEIKIEKTEESVLNKLGMDTSKISSSYSCDEGVIDIIVLRNLLIKDLSSLPISILLSTKVLSCNRVNDSWEVLTSTGNPKKV